MRVRHLIDELGMAVEKLRESERQQALAIEALVERCSLLQATQEQLVRAERLASLGHLTATTAHELRNPLNVIRLASHYLSSHLAEADERLHRHLSHLNLAVERAGAMIDDLLAFAHLPPPNLQSVTINDLVRSALATFEEPDHVTVDWLLAPALPPVLADSRQLMQALGILGLNALQAMPEGGRLSVRSRRSGGHVQITLRDTGSGVPQELHERIFEPFFSTKVAATGLGLHMVREILAAHRGHVCLESAWGEGASFTLSLPVAEKPEGPERSALPEPP